MISQCLLSVRALLVVSTILLIALLLIDVTGLRPYNSLPRRAPIQLPLESPGANPGLQLQLAWCTAQIKTILDPTLEQTALGRNIADVAMGNVIDSFLFIPTYVSLLTALAALGVVAGNARYGRLFTAVAIGIAILAMADWLENLAIVEVLRHVSHDPVHALHPLTPNLDAADVSASALVKWSALAAVSCLLSVQFFKVRPRWGRLVGLATLALGAAVVYLLAAYAGERLRIERQSVGFSVAERTCRG